MFNFAPKYNSYNKVDPKEFKKQIDAAYHHGMNGNETNPPVIAARTKSNLDVVALERVIGLLSYCSGTTDLHKRLRAHIIQERYWLEHHDKCIDATKRGFEKLKSSAKVLIEEAFAAGELQAERAFKTKKDQPQFKADSNNKDAKPVDTQFKAKQDDNNQHNKGYNQQHNDKGGKAPPVTLVIKKLVVSEDKKGKKNKNGQAVQFKQRPN